MGTWTDKEPYPANFIPALLADTWNRFCREEEPAHIGPDGFPVFANSPRAAEHALISEFLAETWAILEINFKPKDYASGRAILDLDDAAKLRAIIAIIERYPWFWKTGVRRTNEGPFGLFAKGGYEYNEPIGRMNLGFLLIALLRDASPIPAPEFAQILTALREPPDCELLGVVTPKLLVRLVSAQWPSGGIPATIVEKLTKIESHLKKQYSLEWGGGRAEDRKVMQELGILVGRAAPPLINPGEAWSDLALADLAKMSGEKSAQWLGLLTHCQKAESSKPAKKWLAEASALVAQIGRDDFKSHVLRWFEPVGLPRTATLPHDPNTERADPNQLIEENNATVLRGLVWCFAGWKDPQVSSALSALAEVCFKKIRWEGPRCPRVGNACLYSLSSTSSDDAAAQLSRLDSTVKQPTAKKRIGKALETAASLTGQTREDLEEKSIPTFDLDLNGKFTRVFGEYSARLQIIESRDLEITWSGADGKTFKSIPAEVKRTHAHDLKQFQKLGKDIEKMLTAQRIRVERLLMAEREWDFESWRQRYLQHPLLANVTRRLIWHFKLGEQSTLGAWRGDKIVDVNNREIQWLAPETRVRLWHPIGFPVETVAAWRDWLQANQVCQPFKQAHREIYILTEAEVQTHTYSNRFAAHILGQHQFAALCKDRGWKYQFMGGFDLQSTPTLELPARNLAVEFWVEPAGELAATGVSLYLTTDQVRFVRDGEPLPLIDIPALVFSEVMRDVDLFVGVGSIGANPEWQDHGEIDGGGDYWRAYSFGDLNESAKTRKEFLQRLIPKLKIAPQCAFDGNFLVVRGSLRTYRIHLGSGNIQMEPNSAYLCIVPGQGAIRSELDKVFLPFEGDRMLSIILSKAFLLANDAKIKDESILSQIRAS